MKHRVNKWLWELLENFGVPIFVFKEIKPEEFEDYNEPGWGKVAGSVTVELYLTGSTICF